LSNYDFAKVMIPLRILYHLFWEDTRVSQLMLILNHPPQTLAALALKIKYGFFLAHLAQNSVN